MSLINKMLRDLEKRDSSMPDNQELVLDGLYSAYDVELQDSTPSNRMLKILSVALITVLLVIFFVWLDPDKIYTLSTNSVVAPVAQEQVENLVPDSIGDITVLPKVQELAVTADTTPYTADGSVAVEPDPMVRPDELKPGTPVVIEEIVLESTEKTFVFSFRLPEQLGYRVHTTESPYSVVIEINGANFQGVLPVIDDLPQITRLLTRNTDDGKFTFVLESIDPLNIVDAGYAKSEEGHLLQLAIANQATKETPIVKEDVEEVSEIVKAELPEETVTQGEVIKTPNNSSRVQPVEKLLIKSQDLFRQGKVAEGLDLLYSVVTQEDGHVQARLTLALRLIEQGQTPLAITLLEEGITKYPNHSEWTKLLARVHINAGNYQLARDTLGRAMPPVSADTEYHALYAAVLQHLANHQEAVSAYRGLVSVQPDNGIWWMGLAISLEGIARKHDALFAYKNALNGKSLTPETHQYIVQRIRALEKS